MGLGVSQFGNNVSNVVITLQNGLNKPSANIGELGGTLIKNTTISQGNFTYSHTGNSGNPLLYLFGSTNKGAFGRSLLFDNTYTFEFHGSGNVGYGFFGTQSVVLRFNNGTTDAFLYKMSETDPTYPSYFRFINLNNNIIFQTEITGGLLISPTGKIGIGLMTPTAWLHIRASDGSANTAPIKLSPGTLLSFEEDGVLEYDGSDLCFTIGTTRYKVQLNP